jgi:hypothetical protein
VFPVTRVGKSGVDREQIKIKSRRLSSASLFDQVSVVYYPVWLEFAIMRSSVLALILVPGTVLGQVALWGQCK